MKKSTNLFATIGKSQVENLTSIVKETLAAGYQDTLSRTFTAADLWNIQRQKRSLTKRRFSF